MLAIFYRFFPPSDPDKRNDDERLLELNRWTSTYTPESIENIHDSITQQQRITEMVSDLLYFRNSAALEDDISRHFKNVIARSCPDARRFLAMALANTPLEQLLKKRLQTAVEHSFPGTFRNRNEH